MNAIYSDKCKIYVSAAAGVYLQMLFGSYLHVFIEQNHQSEAEEGACGHHANQNGCEEFMRDDSLCDTHGSHFSWNRS